MIEPTRYKKRPVAILAMKYTEESEVSLIRWAGAVPSQVPGTLYISTLEGDMRAEIGDYVIRGVQGEFYPCKPAIFEATYELVGEEEE